MRTKGEVVLVGILKRKRDRAILFRDHWYHIPVGKAPRRAFRYLAFYEPARFGVAGKCIHFYARAVRRRMRKRKELFPDEAGHPHANERYWRVQVGRIHELSRPIKNVPPRRVSFGFTTLSRLRAARTILELYWVYPSEAVVSRALARERITAIPQYRISGGGKRYCLDFAIPCRRGAVAIECDNRKAHAGVRVHRRDRAKDIFLRRRGWVVIRLSERAIISDIGDCMMRVWRAVRAHGGMNKKEP
ncbi:MAG: DUF559 domain-containing protein [Candidatus Jorgensenbacteria bacterium]|nr:DUF559 domain-containing protein [Candidatus Jorgensenbacteria bacterium]